jgi:type IV secretory pathway TraG/TraD family ATPase VirD4
MNDNEQTPEVQSPLQRVFITASIACFASLIFFYWVARPAVKLLEVRWIELLVYATIPISVIFVILYRSCWHREITGAARTCSLLLLSGIILGSELIATGIILCVAMFCLNAIQGGNH